MRHVMWAGAALLAGALPMALTAASAPAAAAQAARPPAMRLMTTGWADGDDIPVRFSQAGEQVSPPFTWTNAPVGTRSFVLHMRDPDVARNKTTEDQVHWLVWNIPGDATGLPEGQPEGATLPNSAKQTSASGMTYRGPGAPASGPKHHYTFELFALDTTLDVDHGSDAFDTRTQVYAAMQGHILGKAVYAGLFHRPE